MTIVMGSEGMPAEVATPNTTARIWASGRWLAPVRQTQTGNCRHKRSMRLLRAMYMAMYRVCTVRKSFSYD